MYVKGVNLGNWLVLEKWMSPALLREPQRRMNIIFPHSFPKRYMKPGLKSTVRST